MKKLVFTGGGTAGHVTPNLAIIKEIRHEDNRTGSAATGSYSIRGAANEPLYVRVDTNLEPRRVVYDIRFEIRR